MISRLISMNFVHLAYSNNYSLKAVVQVLWDGALILYINDDRH